MQEYYSKRAEELEEIYQTDDKTRLKELKILEEKMKKFLKGRKVVEIGAGTGFWAQKLAESAKELTVTCLTEKNLNVARRKAYSCRVFFRREDDPMDLLFPSQVFDGAIANFFISHIPRQKIHVFLNELHRVLKTGARIFLTDNVFVPGRGGELILSNKNTYKIRTLSDGSQFKVTKNYYTANELIETFSEYDKSFGMKNIFYGEHFWAVKYKLNPQ